MPPDHDADHVLEHQGFLQRLAAGLLRDADGVEDLVQQTWLVALQQDGPKPRRWLARVLRNLAINGRVADRRRVVRERRAARPEVQAPDVDVQLETQSRVLEAVRTLPEPQKTAIYLRYYHDLGPTAIARRLDVPVPTIKARLVRGRQLLREELDRQLGSRKAWAAPLSSGLLAKTSLLGVLLMNSSFKVAGALVLAGLGAWLVWQTVDAPPHPNLPSGVADAEQTWTAPLEQESASQRIALDAGVSAADSNPDGRAELFGVRALVLDTRGQPLGGVAVGIPGNAGAEPSRAVSGADGIAEFPGLAEGGTVVAMGNDTTTVMSGYADDLSGRTTPVVVVGPRQPVAGMVVDASGMPIAGVAVSVNPPAGFRSRFEHVLDQSMERHPATTTDEDGRFEVSWVAGLEGCALSAHLLGYARHAEQLPAFGADRLVVTLRAPADDTTVVSGMVVDPVGEPVARARVSLGGTIEVSDASGLFRLERDDPARRQGPGKEKLAGMSVTVVALKPGYLPGTLEVPLDPQTGEEIWPEQVVLRLGAEPLAVAGRVVDPAGQPLGGVEVWIDDPSFFSLRGQCMESLLGGSRNDRWHVTHSDDDGRFRLEGLLDREYRLGAYDSAAMQQTYLSTRAGREDLQVVINRSLVIEQVVGRVVTGDGAPLPDAGVHVMTEMVRPQYLGREIRSSTYLRRSTTTDDEGRFMLQGVAREGLQLFIQSPETFAARVGHGYGAELGEMVDAGGELEITVSRRMHVQVVLDDPTEGDRVGALDFRGEPALIYSFRVKEGQGKPRELLMDGRSEVFAVRDTVGTVVLYLGEQEVRRIPVSLLPDGVNTVR